MSTTATLKIKASAQAELREQLAAAGFEFRSVDHAFWQARGDATLTFYRSGKLVVQGKLVEPFVVLGEEFGGAVSKWSGPGRDQSDCAPSAPSPLSSADTGPFASAVAKLPDPKPTAWIGIDEAGKGDYFGPLVTVAARVELAQLPLLKELGIGDSKRIADGKIKKIAAKLKHVVPYQRVVLMPPKYNELYSKFSNLNRLLAWCHAAAAESLLEQGVEAELILSDQFAKTDIVKRSLKERGRALRFTQRTKAEEDPAVACASIFARAEFLYRMDELATQHSVALHKGAGPPVVAAARAIVAERGKGLLPELVKMHFKTTQGL
ncbi:MAG: ribonuclease HIII [Bradymonadia bacterium]|jgi:ribonuclease HIII